MFGIPNDNRIQGKIQDEAQQLGNEEVSLAVETEVEPIDPQPKDSRETGSWYAGDLSWR